MASLEGRTGVDITRGYECQLGIYVWFLKRLIKREKSLPLCKHNGGGQGCRWHAEDSFRAAPFSLTPGAPCQVSARWTVEASL